MENRTENRLYENFQTNWLIYTYYLGVLLVISMVYAETFHSKIGTVFTGAFAILLFLAGFPNLQNGIKYILSTGSLLALFAIVHYTPLDITDLFPFIFYIPLLYTLIFLDKYSTMSFGIAVTLITYTVVSHEPFSSVFGNVISVLSAAVAYTIIAQLIMRLKWERDRYHQKSITDPLTGLTTLVHALDVGRKMSQEETISAILIDIDHFKQFNDTYGHLTGNKILIQIANRLRAAFHGTNHIIGRLGGDEFIIFLSSSRLEKAVNQLELLFRNEGFEIDTDLPPIRLSVSIGVSRSIEAKLPIEQLLHEADMNMYQKKYQVHEEPKNEMCLIQPPYDQKVGQLLNVLAEKDMYTLVHSQYVSKYAVMLGEALQFPRHIIQDLHIAGCLHDIGKILVPGNILRKPSKLSENEYAIIKQHVLDGENILKNLALSDVIYNAILNHHERWDGLGYPHGIKGEDTPIEGRILQIADAFSAMSIKRLYHEQFSVDEAFDELRRVSGKQFDPHLVNVFIENFKP